jgi:hypothetical protein
MNEHGTTAREKRGVLDFINNQSGDRSIVTHRLLLLSFNRAIRLSNAPNQRRQVTSNTHQRFSTVRCI